MSTVRKIELDLSGTERNLLVRGLWEWGGPARCTEEMARAIGFRDVADLLDEGHRIADDLSQGRALTEIDWRRALLATEVVFASNVLGSGIDWCTTTGMSDEETMNVLRSVQRKISRLGRDAGHVH